MCVFHTRFSVTICFNCYVVISKVIAEYVHVTLVFKPSCLVILNAPGHTFYSTILFQRNVKLSPDKIMVVDLSPFSPPRLFFCNLFYINYYNEHTHTHTYTHTHTHARARARAVKKSFVWF